jgi:branched-chain amino acid transport system ATP-binding protein
MLKIKEIHTGYGKKPVLFGVSLAVGTGEIVSIVGPNGAGKSTILKAVCGLIDVWEGEIFFADHKINDSSPARNVKRGMVFCPQGNRVFDELSVRENLEIGGINLPKKELATGIDEVLQLFPALKDQLKQNSGTLSGGEKQMLALARSLITRPKLLLLDEPSLGLSPGLIADAFEKIQRINLEMKTTVLIVEQKVREVLKISHRVYGIKLGKVAFDGPPEKLLQQGELQRVFL